MIPSRIFHWLRHYKLEGHAQTHLRCVLYQSSSSHMNINIVSRLPADYVDANSINKKQNHTSTGRDTKRKKGILSRRQMFSCPSGVDYFLDGTLVKYSSPKVVISVKNLAAKCIIWHFISHCDRVIGGCLPWSWFLQCYKTPRIYKRRHIRTGLIKTIARSKSFCKIFQARIKEIQDSWLSRKGNAIDFYADRYGVSFFVAVKWLTASEQWVRLVDIITWGR